MKRLALTLFALLVMCDSGTSALATDDNIWRQDQEFSVTRDPYELETLDRPCTVEYITVFVRGLFHPNTFTCTYKSANLQIANFTATGVQVPGYTLTGYAVKKADETYFTFLEGLSPHVYTISLLPQNGRMLIKHGYNSPSTEPDYDLYLDPSLSLEYDPLTLTYKLDDTQRISLLEYKGSTPNRIYAKRVSLSSSVNGRYLIAYSDLRYVSIIDTDDGSERVVGYIKGYDYGYSNPEASAVSNDGRYLLVGNSNQIFDTHGSCGQVLTASLLPLDSKVSSPCKHTDLSWLIYDSLRYEYGGVNYQFAPDAKSFSFITYYLYTSGAKRETVTVSTERHQNDPEVKRYIAIGDSYTSGEGDYQAGLADSNYVLGTGHAGGCHLSRNSYPYRIMHIKEMSLDSVMNVSCSGARGIPDILNRDDASSYFGQNNRYAGQDIFKLQNDALNSGMPGVVSQLKFVEYYKPEYVTLMSGGNDIGFGEIIKDCANFQATIPTQQNCDYVQKNTLPYQALKARIETQLYRTQAIIREIKKISPQTKIYVVGYPSFIADSSSRVCKLAGAGFLTRQEKTGINLGIKSLNSILKSAADATSVEYIDIENALVGGRLCETDAHYVTGINDIGMSNLKDENIQELFHPNAVGHQKIAEYILKQSPQLLN